MRRPRIRVFFLVELADHRKAWWPDLLGTLDRADVEVIPITVRPRGSLHEQLDSIQAPSGSLGCRRANDYPMAIARLAREARRERIDVIHGCESIPGALGALTGITVGRRVARVFHRQHVVVDGASARISRVASKLSHITVACSEAAAVAANQIDRVPPSRIRVVYNGSPSLRSVAPAEIKELRNRLAIPDPALVVSAVARLRPEKGLTTLLAAAPIVGSGLDVPLHVVLVGSGPQEAELAALSRSISGATIHMVGHQDDVAPWLAMADVLAMPSRREAFGYAAAEAMAAGRPLVASSVGGLKELVEPGVSGLLVEPDSPDDLADRLLVLLRDPVERDRMGEAARRRFDERFTIKRMAPALLAVWREACEMRSS